MKIFKLPDLGEGLLEATIIKWYVEEGQEIELNQLLLTLESAKATVDIPASFKGKILRLFGSEGGIINTGDPLIGFEGDNLLETTEDQGIVGKMVKENVIFDTPISSNISPFSETKISLEAKTLARKFHLNLNAIQFDKEWVSVEDVQQILNLKAASPTQVPLSGKRLVMAKRMLASQKEVVPVTCSCEVELCHWEANQDISTRVIRAIGKACQQVPILNASFQYSSMHYNLNEKVNLGVAFDSIDGTYLPVIKDVVNLTLLEIREKINAFKAKIKHQGLTPEDCAHPTILLSNFGSLGAFWANPIIIPPMVAIIGIGKLQEKINHGKQHHRKY